MKLCCETTKQIFFELYTDVYSMLSCMFVFLFCLIFLFGKLASGIDFRSSKCGEPQVAIDTKNDKNGLVLDQNV